MSSTVERLIEAARRGELHHSLVLHGPSMEALRTTAFAIARVLNCSSGAGDDECGGCTRIDRGTHPDVRVISVESDRKLISVDQIRKLIEAAMLRPYEGRCKVFILEQADAMSPGGANALLKTLEEPGSDTNFLLLTRSPELLLPTVRSRSQVLPVRDELRGDARAIAREDNVPLQVARVLAEHPSLSGADASALVDAVSSGLRAWSEQRDAAALLAVAASIGGLQPPGEMLSAFAETLRDLAALSQSDCADPAAAAAIRTAIPAAALLRAAAVAVRGVGRLVVNVDPRLVVEQSLAELTIPEL